MGKYGIYVYVIKFQDGTFYKSTANNLKTKDLSFANLHENIEEAESELNAGKTCFNLGLQEYEIFNEAQTLKISW